MKNNKWKHKLNISSNLKVKYCFVATCFELDHLKVNMKLIYFIYDDLLYLCIQLFVDQHLFVCNGSVAMLLQMPDFLFADGSGPMTGERVEFRVSIDQSKCWSERNVTNSSCNWA